MQNLFQPTSRRQLLERLERLRADAPARWGTLTPERMLCHVADQLRIGLGEIEAPHEPNPMAWPGVRWFFISAMRWPRAKIQTHPAVLTTAPTTFEADRERLWELIERFAERGPDGSFSPHPKFGALPPRLWGRLAWRHLDYHLRQFGA